MSERIFIHLQVGLTVYVNGCQGTYHPSDFLENGIITLAPPQEAITHGQ